MKTGSLLTITTLLAFFTLLVAPTGIEARKNQSGKRLTGIAKRVKSRQRSEDLALDEWLSRKPLTYRSWVNLTKSQGYSDKMINFGIYSKTNTYFQQKYWTFDKAEIGRKEKSIPRYNKPLTRYQSIKSKLPEKSRPDHILRYFRNKRKNMFRPTRQSPKFFQKEKAPIYYGLSNEKFE